MSSFLIGAALYPEQKLKEHIYSYVKDNPVFEEFYFEKVELGYSFNSLMPVLRVKELAVKLAFTQGVFRAQNVEFSISIANLVLWRAWRRLHISELSFREFPDQKRLVKLSDISKLKQADDFEILIDKANKYCDGVDKECVPLLAKNLRLISRNSWQQFDFSIGYGRVEDYNKGLLNASGEFKGQVGVQLLDSTLLLQGLKFDFGNMQISLERLLNKPIGYPLNLSGSYDLEFSPEGNIEFIKFYDNKLRLDEVNGDLSGGYVNSNNWAVEFSSNDNLLTTRGLPFVNLLDKKLHGKLISRAKIIKNSTYEGSVSVSFNPVEASDFVLNTNAVIKDDHLKIERSKIRVDFLEVDVSAEVENLNSFLKGKRENIALELKLAPTPLGKLNRLLNVLKTKNVSGEMELDLSMKGPYSLLDDDFSNLKWDLRRAKLKDFKAEFNEINFSKHWVPFMPKINKFSGMLTLDSDVGAMIYKKNFTKISGRLKATVEKVDFEHVERSYPLSVELKTQKFSKAHKANFKGEIQTLDNIISVQQNAGKFSAIYQKTVNPVYWLPQLSGNTQLSFNTSSVSNWGDFSKAAVLNFKINKAILRLKALKDNIDLSSGKIALSQNSLSFSNVKAASLQSKAVVDGKLTFANEVSHKLKHAGVNIKLNQIKDGDWQLKDRATGRLLSPTKANFVPSYIDYALAKWKKSGISGRVSLSADLVDVNNLKIKRLNFQSDFDSKILRLTKLQGELGQGVFQVEGRVDRQIFAQRGDPLESSVKFLFKNIDIANLNQHFMKNTFFKKGLLGGEVVSVAKGENYEQFKQSANSRIKLSLKTKSSSAVKSFAGQWEEILEELSSIEKQNFRLAKNCIAEDARFYFDINSVDGKDLKWDQLKVKHVGFEHFVKNNHTQKLKVFVKINSNCVAPKLRACLKTKMGPLGFLYEIVLADDATPSINLPSKRIYTHLEKCLRERSQNKFKERHYQSTDDEENAKSILKGF